MTNSTNIIPSNYVLSVHRAALCSTVLSNRAFQMMKMFYFSVSNTVGSSHMCLLSIWNVGGLSEELDFHFTF